MLSKIVPASVPALLHKALLACHATPGLPARRRARLVMASRSLPAAAPAAAGRRALSVAVVGAGAAGLVAARELEREGHAATVYEAGVGVGGVWRYTEETEEDDLLGLNPDRRRVHGSMYAGLRTNLPREVMGYTDFPFDSAFPGSEDSRQFPSHAEVQRYIGAFAEQYNLGRLVQCHTTVEAAVPLMPDGGGSDGGSGVSSTAWQRWQLSLRRGSGAAAGTSGGGSPGGGNHHQEAVEAVEQQQYDAVVVCNGHYSEPRLPAFPGQDVFPALQLHSHNYRRPERFRGQTVVLVGASSSGVDIAEELAVAGARTVYLCARDWQNPLTGEPLLGPDESPTANIPGVSHPSVIRCPNLAALRGDGSVVLEGGATLAGVHAVMYCTGYHYAFPFLEGTGAVSTDDNRVAPLYQHVFPPALAPTLAFIGLPWKVLPLPQMELQAKWVARVLSGRSALPPAQEMLAAAQAFYAELEAGGTPVRYTHRQAGDVQWQYNQWLAEACGPDVPAWPDWRVAMYEATGAARREKGAAYRDLPLVGMAAAEAAARFEAARVRSQQAPSYVRLDPEM